MYIKLYIHHFFSDILFYKIGHNTYDRKFEINKKTNLGVVKAKYDENDLEFIFDPVIHNHQDGLHIIDYYHSKIYKNQNPTFRDVNYTDDNDVIPFLEKYEEILKDKENWIILFLRTEKIYGKHDALGDYFFETVDKKFNSLNKHRIISDNINLENRMQFLYPNIYFAFTNHIWQWNEQINIRYYYEFKQIFDKLNFDYDLMYSVRNHKKHRIEILKGLSEYNNPKILLQRTDTQINQFYKKFNNELEILPNIFNNKLEGQTDFTNLKIIQYRFGIDHDIFFRFLSKAKMQVLDESWAWKKGEYYIQYLSEKTIGLILAGIPFISTHSYPLIFLQKILNITPHPFIKDFDNIKGDSKLFVDFVKKFMNNYEYNYILCKNWTDDVHKKFIDKIESENSLLNLIFSDFNRNIIDKDISKKLL